MLVAWLALPKPILPLRRDAGAEKQRWPAAIGVGADGAGIE
jgi:hypothetical protein